MNLSDHISLVCRRAGFQGASSVIKVCTQAAEEWMEAQLDSIDAEDNGEQRVINVLRDRLNEGHRPVTKAEWGKAWHGR